MTMNSVRLDVKFFFRCPTSMSIGLWRPIAHKYDLTAHIITPSQSKVCALATQIPSTTFGIVKQIILVLAKNLYFIDTFYIQLN